MSLSVRDTLERFQIPIYFSAILAAAVLSVLAPVAPASERAIDPALALMLFVTFLQVPLAELMRTFAHLRFLATLLIGNFLLVPLVVAALFPFLPADPLIRLGVLLVLLTPCIDYVVTFSHLGGADARLLLAATPALLLAQMLLLPVYLGLFLGEAAAEIMQWGPFLQAFAWLIAGPLALAALVQAWAARSTAGIRVARRLSLLPVPATAAVLFIIVATVMPQLDAARGAALRVVPVYAAFAVAAPCIGWGVARLLGLAAPAGRAAAFSTGTRNSLVVLPLALSIPGAIPVLPAVIVAQTMVELIGELAYIRLIRRLGRTRAA